MITKLQRLTTGLSIIQEIPETFFREIENSTEFGDHLFPTWANRIFVSTFLKSKFQSVYDRYKEITPKASRDKIVDAFIQCNQIENLCTNQAGTIIIEFKELPASIREDLAELFLYLYNTAINYKPFETFVSHTLKQAIDKFIRVNELEVCPFCGLEGFLNIKGQSRIALDHWLCKELFPMAAVNIDNLFPIGHDCNGRATKGSKNILIDSPKTKKRVRAYYPYLNHGGVQTSFQFVKEPSSDGITDDDWQYTITPTNPADQEIFDSWISIMNISTRYHDYLVNNVFNMWEGRYRAFIDRHPTLKHANTIKELKVNFEHWKASFDIKFVTGSILYIPFINYLINDASDACLFELCENFKR